MTKSEALTSDFVYSLTDIHPYRLATTKTVRFHLQMLTIARMNTTKMEFELPMSTVLKEEIIAMAL